MNDIYLHWFAASAVVINALISIVRPDNAACPLVLTPTLRAGLAAALGLAAAAFLNLSRGMSPLEAFSTAAGATLVAILHDGQIVPAPAAPPNTPPDNTLH